MRAAAALLLLCACSRTEPEPVDATSVSRTLDQAAVASGQLPDPRTLTAPGAYADDTEIGEDRVCVAKGGEGLRVGLYVSYGTGGACMGRGSGDVSGGRLRLALPGGCEMDARIEPDGLVFPGQVSAACQPLCTGRASWSGVTIPKVSDSEAEALALTDGGGRRLCPSG